MLKNKRKSLTEKIFSKLLRQKPVIFYIENSEKFIKKGDYSKALRILEKAQEKYPHDIELSADIAKRVMNHISVNDSKIYWQKVVKFNTNNLLERDAYLKLAEIYKKREEIQKTRDILSEGIERFMNDRLLLQQYIFILIESNEWEEAVKYIDEYFKLYLQKETVNFYLRVALAYRRSDRLLDAQKVLAQSLLYYPKNKKILITNANIAIFQMKWLEAESRFDRIFDQFPGKLQLNTHVKVAITKKIIGKHVEADEIFDQVLDIHRATIENDEKGYRKIILFDNGHSRIEYYKKLQKTNKLVITFDSINMTWSTKPFAYKFLSRQNVDLIAVRKKKSQTYQQDLLKIEFVEAIKKICSGYKDVISYGYSLGAYSALYYGSEINNRILALAPRLSIHPLYGRPKMKSYEQFKHELNPYNETISPIIVYDPKNKLDNKYVNEGLLNSFPNSKLVEIPYGGHGIAPHLLNMGVLKEFILTVINSDEIPRYNRKLKNKSSIYFRLLADACLKHKKYNWAFDLVNRSLDLLSSDIFAIELKVKVYKELNNQDKAIEFIKFTIENHLDNLDTRLILIDLLIERKRLNEAKQEIKKALCKHKNSTALKKRQAKINSEI